MPVSSFRRFLCAIALACTLSACGASGLYPNFDEAMEAGDVVHIAPADAIAEARGKTLVMGFVSSRNYASLYFLENSDRLAYQYFQYSGIVAYYVRDNLICFDEPIATLSGCLAFEKWRESADEGLFGIYDEGGGLVAFTYRVHPDLDIRSEMFGVKTALHEQLELRVRNAELAEASPRSDRLARDRRGPAHLRRTRESGGLSG